VKLLGSAGSRLAECKKVDVQTSPFGSADLVSHVATCTRVEFARDESPSMKSCSRRIWVGTAGVQTRGPLVLTAGTGKHMQKIATHG
jgi:hypothetical protein